jgi:lipopolysaccharide export system protein LptA
MCQSGNRSRLAAACFLVAACLAGTSLRAELADRDKPVSIEADSMVADDSRKTATFEGKVVLTQGSLVISGDKIVVRQDGEGFQHGVATGAPATFRQKQESQGECVDAEAHRIEYDGRTERVEFFNAARLRRDSGDDVRGDYISYDARNERFTVKSSGDTSEGGRDRVRATIMPKKKELPPPSPAASPCGRPK